MDYVTGAIILLQTQHDMRILRRIAALLTIPDYDTLSSYRLRESIEYRFASSIIDSKMFTHFIVKTNYVQLVNLFGINPSLNKTVITDRLIHLACTCTNFQHRLVMRLGYGIPIRFYNNKIRDVTIRETSTHVIIIGLNLNNLFDSIYVQYAVSDSIHRGEWRMCIKYKEHFITWINTVNKVKSLFHCASIRINIMNIPDDILDNLLTKPVAHRVNIYKMIPI